MASKFVVVLTLVAVAHSSVVPVVKVDNDYSSFSYDVADPNTRDYKSQAETRVGGFVKGQYSLLSDGTKRTVDYAADDFNGFNAVVRKDPVIITAPGVAAPTFVASTPVVASAPAVLATRTIVAPSPAIGAFPAMVAARTLAAPVVAPAPIVAQPYATPVYSSAAVVAARNLAAPTYYSVSPMVGAGFLSPYPTNSGSPYYSAPLNY